MSILSNIEIKKILRNLGINDVYIISKDELKNFNSSNKFIINMDNNTGSGTHWVSLIDNFYFDSYGLIYPNEISNFIDNIYYSNKQIQLKNDTCCGWFCLMFIIYFDKTKINKNSYNKFINQFNNNNNNNILIKFFENLL